MVLTSERSGGSKQVETGWHARRRCKSVTTQDNEHNIDVMNGGMTEAWMSSVYIARE